MRKYWFIFFVISMLLLTACIMIAQGNYDSTSKEVIKDLHFFKKTPNPYLCYEYNIRIETDYMSYMLELPRNKINYKETEEDRSIVELKFE